MLSCVDFIIISQVHGLDCLKLSTQVIDKVQSDSSDFSIPRGRRQPKFLTQHIKPR